MATEVNELPRTIKRTVNALSATLSRAEPSTELQPENPIQDLYVPQQRDWHQQQIDDLRRFARSQGK